MFTSHTRARTTLRSLAVIAATGLAAATLAGCAPSADAGDGGAADSGTVDWWGWTPEQNVATEYISAFNEEYPDITVNFRQLTIDGYEAALRPALASNVGPDLFNVAPGAQFVQFSTYATDLTASVEESLGSDWSDQLAPIGVAGLSDEDGNLRAIPTGSTFAGPVWINQGLFDQYGLTPPTTMDEWVEVCEQFRANDVGCFVQGASQTAFDQDTIQAIADTINPGLFTKATIGEAEWTDPDLVTAFATWQRMFDDGIMQEGALGIQQYPDANNAFMSQEYAMVMMGTWYMQFTRPANMVAAIEAAGVAPAEPFTMVPIPFPAAEAGGTPGAMFGDANYGLAVNAKSPDRNAATTFATWLGTSLEGQQIVANALNDIPSAVEISPEFEGIELVAPEIQQPKLEELIERAATVTDNRLLPNSDLADAIGVAATTLAAGDVTPEEAVETLQASAEASGVTFE
ncbi:ABC transporter substrate-binding protein [Planctomonas psychrotolerans]|uniref:ABC transporter substrate-binding protein n=1 Tax=Planctomonas psychrotolerans TaxID=2528712 RepID=UPI001D0D21AF|nr:ABC transporter substrate-binding protein [Planctomonas psychrotolerans]